MFNLIKIVDVCPKLFDNDDDDDDNKPCKTKKKKWPVNKIVGNNNFKKSIY